MSVNLCRSQGKKVNKEQEKDAGDVQRISDRGGVGGKVRGRNEICVERKG